jgi:hypothetical protein
MRYAPLAPFALTVVTALLFLSNSVGAQVPDSLGFQGYLTRTDDSPLDSTGVSMTFKLYKEGTPVWTETQLVNISGGAFRVFLGKNTPLDTLAFDQAIVLGTKLDGEASELLPRTPLASVPYALSVRGLRVIPAANPDYYGPNLIGGHSSNSIEPGVWGATIGGGGGLYHNEVSATYATISGGSGNRAEGHGATIGGGLHNHATAHVAAVLGGNANYATAPWSIVGGGVSNGASGDNSTVGGGFQNIAGGDYSMVLGGRDNEALGAYSFASGKRAIVRAEDSGTFVWADNTEADFESQNQKQFLIRAANGVGINTNDPQGALHVAGDYYGKGHLYLYAYQGDGSSGTAYVQARDKTSDSQISLQFRTKNGAVLPNVMRLTADAKVGIYTQTPSERLEVNGNVKANNVTVPSDARYKKDVAPIRDALALIQKLDGIAYSWRTAEYPDRDFDENRHLGFMAQDVREIVPEAVHEDPDGMLSLSYQQLIPVLVEAVKEQQAEIERLERLLIAN